MRIKELQWSRDNVKLILDVDRKALVPLMRWIALDRISVVARPLALAFDGAYMWVASENGFVCKIDTATNTVIATVFVGSYLGALAFDGDSMWVADSSGHNFTAINPVTNTVRCGWVAQNISGPCALAFDGVNMWAANWNSNNVSRVFFQSPPVSVGSRPCALAFDGVCMWVANSGSNNVSKIDPVTNTVIATIDVGINPRALAFDGVYMWVANHVSNNVSRIEVTCDVVISPKGVGHGPCALAFDGVYMWAAISSYVSKVAAFDFRYFPYFSNPL